MTFDLAANTLTAADGREVSLTRGEFVLLATMLAGRGRTLSRDQLLDAVAGRRAEPFDRSVDVMIGRLRRKIERDPRAPRLIQTVPGFGYKFTASVRQGAAGTSHASQAAGIPAQAARALAERRYVTVFAAELTSAAGRSLPADPTALRAFTETFRRQAAALITRDGGSVTNCHGRELLACFGYPLSQEHAADCAIRAGLALRDRFAAGEAASHAGLAVRVGIASGLVLTDPDGEVTGQAADIAERLQDVAEPGQVIVAASARYLAGSLFICHARGDIAVVGLANPVRAWQALAPSARVSHSEAHYAEPLAPLVGREEELGQLLDAWRMAKSGTGRLVLLSGKAGVGKSRLLAALEQELAEGAHASLWHFCSPLHQDSPLHPVIARWGQEAGFVQTDSGEERLRKLGAIPAVTNHTAEEVALLAAMLSVPTDGRYPPLASSPQRQKEGIYAALLRSVTSRATRQPLLMVFEDVHWADPSSLELLDLLMDRIAALPILLVVSHRPDFIPPWVGRPGAGLIALSDWTDAARPCWQGS